ncbi:MAG: hypothetical protein ACE15B_01855 [Bryobacteraceae bacterium]
MTEAPGPYRTTRRSWLAAGLALPVSRAFTAPAGLSATWDGDNIHISAPQLRFLSGKPLERLKDGAAVTFFSQLSISTDQFATVFRRLPERFVVSYDLWEEKFSVNRLSGAPRSASHLAAGAAEAWCLESMVVSASGLAPERPFWLRFELRASDARDEAAIVGEPGINITRLIEFFSRRPRSEQPQWTLEAGPLELRALRRTEHRGPRTG